MDKVVRILVPSIGIAVTIGNGFPIWLAAMWFGIAWVMAFAVFFED